MKDLKTTNSKRVNSKMNTSNEKTTEQKIIQWYAEKVHYDMVDAIDEIKWLVDNLKPKAFQQILDFYDEIECMSLSSWIKNNK